MIVTSAGLLASVPTGVISGGVRSIRNANREFTRDLSWRAIGVHASQVQAIEYAAEYGFESVYADAGYLSSLDAGARADLASLMSDFKEKSALADEMDTWAADNCNTGSDTAPDTKS